MIVCSYNIHDKQPTIHKQVEGKRLWLITLNVSNDGEQISKTIRNKQRSFLHDLISITLDEIQEMINEMPSAKDASFTVQLLR